jgi:lipopolysaccharide transport system permease protein
LLGPQTFIDAKPRGVLSYLSPLTLGRSLWRHRSLISQFIAREVQGRYKGSFLGLFWSFVNPLVLLLIYTFVFGVVLRTRWGQVREGNLADFALVLFCGLIPFNVVSECLNRASGLIIGVPNFVRKVVFPLEILPVTVVGAALFHAGMGLVALLIVSLFVRGAPPPSTLLLLPLAALPLVFLCLGLTWFLAGLGVYVRDVNYVVSLCLQVLLFATPIFYPVEAIPAHLQTLMRFNPLTSLVDDFRRTLLWGMSPDWSVLAFGWLITFGIMMLGYGWFMKTKSGFADVL